MKNKLPSMWRTGVVGGDGFTTLQNIVRNEPYTYYTVYPTVPSTAEKATCVIDKSARKKKLHQTKTEQNCVLQNVHVNVYTGVGGGGGSGDGRKTILLLLAAKDYLTAASAEL
ncbi:hypothetical protein QTP88_012670 [Uroleucon formosanum]